MSNRIEDRELNALLLEGNVLRMQEYKQILASRVQNIQEQMADYKARSPTGHPDKDHMQWYQKAKAAMLLNMNAISRLKAAIANANAAANNSRKKAPSKYTSEPRQAHKSQRRKDSPIIGKLIQYRLEYQRPKPSVAEIEFLRRELFAMVDALLLLSRMPQQETLLWQADEDEELGEKVLASLTP